MSIPTTEIELSLGGMTCASCANRIERKLNKLDGVQASVNYATEKARVQAPADLDPAVLVAQVEAAGYTATLPAPPATDDAAVAEPDPTHPLRDRLVVSGVLAIPVIALAMVPALQFTYWQWISLTLAAPVAVWGAWPFHRAAWTNLRHGATTMDTLVSTGVLAAFGWSVWALVFGTAGEPGMVHPFTLAVSRGDAAGQIYLEVAAGVTTFLLAGRYFEARSKRRAGAALRALLELGAKDVAVLRPTSSGADGRELRIPIDRLAVGDRFVVRPGEKVATDGVVEEGRSAVDAALLTGESVPVDVGPGDAVVGATVNAGGRLVVRATRVGADTQLAQMAKLVDDAQSGKAPVQRLADRISGVFVPIVIALAAATLGFWLGTGAGVAGGLHRRRRGADHRLPVRAGPRDADGAARRHRPRRQAGHPDQGPGGAGGDPARRHVVLDKTGTVTAGRMALVEVHVADGVDRGRGAAAGRGGGGRARSTRWRRRSSHGGAVDAGSVPPPRRGVRERRGPRRAGRRRRPRGAGRPPGAARAVEHRAAAAAGRGAGRRAVPRADRGGGGVGRRGAGGARGRRHRQADVGRGGRAGCARSACVRCC